MVLRHRVSESSSELPNCSSGTKTNLIRFASLGSLMVFLEKLHQFPGHSLIVSESDSVR